MTQRTNKIGQNRGKPRLWIEGKFLQEAGFIPPLRYNFENNVFTLHPEGKRKISGKPQRPIIDITGRDVPVATAVTLTITNPGEITLHVHET